jgi:TP901 family phage tail tape measure protein
MAGSLGDLMLRLGLDTAAFNAALGGIGSRLEQAATDAEKAWSPIAGIGSNLTTVGAGLTAGITAPIAAIGATATTAASDFESAMNRVSALGEITGSNLDKLTAQALQLGKDTKYSATEAAQGMGELAAAGFNATQIMQAMPGVLDLAASGEMAVGQAAEIASNLMAGFGIPADQISRAVDAIAVSAASGSLSVQDIGNTMKYVGPVATAAGLSFEEITAAVTLLSNAGIKGEQAGTSLRGAIASLISPSTSAASTLAQLGVEATTSDGKLRPLNDVFLDLKTAGASTSDIFTIFGRETASAATVLQTVAGPQLADMKTKLLDADGAAARMAGTLNSGLKGGFEQLGGSVETVGIKFGQVLAPAVSSITTGLQYFVDNIVSPAVDWFGRLPQPIQNAGIAFGALLAAAGPIALAVGGVTTAISTMMPAITGIGAALGIGTTAVLGWAAASPLAVAALVALGTWFYDNWEPIKAVVSGAWDGLTEMWTAQWNAISGAVKAAWDFLFGWMEPIFGPMREFFGMVWNGIEAIFVQTWTQIKTALSTIWEGIKFSASTVWNGIVSVFQTFLEWAGKIPGVNKLFDLDDAWKSAKKLSEETDKASKSTADLTKKADAGAGTSGKPLPKLSAAIGKVGKEAKDADGKIKPLIDRQTELTATAKLLTDQHDKAEKNVAALKLKLAELKDTVVQIDPPTDAFNASLQAIIASSIDLSKTTIPGVVGQVDSMKTSTLGLNEALGQLGVKSKTEYDKVAADAKRAYDAVVGSGMATPTEQNNAMLAMLKAQKDAMVANGTKIPADMQAMIDKLETTATNPSSGMPKVTGVFTTFGTDLSTMFTGLNTKLTDILWDGDMSWGEKAKAALGALKDSFVDAFITPATDSITSFMTGTLSDLMGGKGFGGLIDRVKDLGKTITDVFGVGSGISGGAADAASGGAGSVPGAGGSAQAAAGAAAQGVMGAINMVTGIVSAVSDVISAIYSIRQEGTLNAIEWNTRKSSLHLESMLDHINTYLPKLEAIDGYLWNTFTPAFASLMTTMESIRDVLIDKEGTSVFSTLTDTLGAGFQGMTDLLGNVAGHARDISDRLETALAGLKEIRQFSAVSGREQTEALREIAAGIRARGDININIYGATDPKATGDEVMRRLRLVQGLA